MIAVLCPGQGSQKPGFLQPWLELPGVQNHLEKLSDAAELDLIHYGTVADEQTIKDTAIAQPLIVAAGIIAGTRYLEATSNLQKNIVFAGHSVGEITAATLSGVLTEEEAMAFTRVRAQGMAQAAAEETTGMAAVLGSDEKSITEAIKEASLYVANMNGAGQIVAAGAEEHLQNLAQNPPAKTRVITLKVAGAFHTPYMEPAQTPLNEYAQTISPSAPQGILISNYDGSTLDTGTECIERLIRQVTAPVRWDLCMETLKKCGVQTAVELSPAGTLLGLVRRTIPQVSRVTLNTPEELKLFVEASQS
ncbi:ACP S-malonyltransferase [Rothia sp. CCM 9419]|uniref:ACP S-malonyltransferase n=1 Tax=Rothia sp. CCM 9419 TaxID=3402662 RepID=UPI003AE77A6E